MSFFQLTNSSYPRLYDVLSFFVLHVFFIARKIFLFAFYIFHYFADGKNFLKGRNIRIKLNSRAN